jgi:hypothetical protein
MYKEVSIIIAAMAIVSMTVAQSPSVMAQEEALINAITGGFESISVVQNPDQIVITITKASTGGGGEPLPDNGTVPTDPIIIVPDPGGEGNGTVIVPQPGNGTIPSGGNVTEPGEPPVIIVDPGNNDTIVVEPPTNVTQIDNGTVIVAPPEQNVTETPGNVTVIDPPVGNSTTEEPAPCGCPPAAPGGTLPIDETGSQPVQPPTEQPPANTGDNQTIVIEQPPVPAQLPVLPPEDGSNNNNDGGNGDNNN